MKISRQQLQQAAVEGILSPGQAEALYHYLKRQPDTGPVFNFTHILYYLGGLTAIGAMTLFMNLGWEEFGGWGILAISVVYAAIGLGIVYLGILWQRHEPLITAWMQALLPGTLRELLAARRQA